MDDNLKERFLKVLDDYEFLLKQNKELIEVNKKLKDSLDEHQFELLRVHKSYRKQRE